MRLTLGIDVGWSARRKTCAFACRGLTSSGTICVRLFRLEEFLKELLHLIRGNIEAFQTAVLVIDGPVGPEIDAVSGRAVDSSFARQGFARRAPAYPITHGSGLRLSQETTRILRVLENCVRVQPWLGGPLPSDRLIVAETNPTCAMALLVEQQVPESLPTRKRRRLMNGDWIRAKSDWYWRLRGGQHAARVLGDPSIAAERHHERVAGLFTLALAVSLAGHATNGEGVVALGDSQGIYLAPSEIHESWKADVERIGVAHGQVTFSR